MKMEARNEYLNIDPTMFLYDASRMILYHLFHGKGLSASKSEYVSKLALEKKIDVILLQELHVATEEDLIRRGNIDQFVLAGYALHPVYGCATYVRHDLLDWQVLHQSVSDNIYTVAIKLGNTTIVNVYKPPSICWPINVMNVYHHPAIYMGDFNSHHTSWAYDASDANGEELYNWSLNNNIHLKFDAKDLYSFRSARWNRDYNPDLCFVSMDHQLTPLFSNRIVLHSFPHSQHRPIILEVGLSIPLVQSIPKPRWNFKKADWLGFTKAMDANIRFIPAVSSNYDRFVKLLISTAKKFIPRGFRKKYIPGWSPTCDQLYANYQDDGNPSVADELLHSLDMARKNDWTALMETIDFRYSSRKSWNLLRKLDLSNSKRNPPSYKCNVNHIASHLLKNGKVPMDKSTANNIKFLLKEKIVSCSTREDPLNIEFSVTEIENAILQLKPNVAVGLDGVFNEFLINFGPRCKLWLAQFYSDVLLSGTVPSTLLKSKIIVFLKPGKTGDQPDHFRPITLLSASYKLLERLLFARIADTIYEVIPPEQAGFRPNRNCCDQVLSLTSFIEAGFQTKLKTGVAYIDLSAAYDTVWRKGLLYKLINVIPSALLIRLLNSMLSNRSISIYLGDKSSRTRRLNEGLPQGSVLAPLLFILYISDLPSTRSNKFAYADDIALAVQHTNFDIIETNLSADLQILWQYFKEWRLRPNINKTTVNFHHLTNCLSQKAPDVYVEETKVEHNPTPKYLGVVLDRSLTYKHHIGLLAKKLKTRINIISKLAGSSWGANAHTLRTSALALVFSVAEYCCPVWLNSHHVSKIDVEINKCLRIITGCVSSTPLPWLHVLSNIAPPSIRRQNQSAITWSKIADNPDLLCHKIISNQPERRLSSRIPSFQTASTFFHGSVFSFEEAWSEFWSSSDVQNKCLISDITSLPTGFNLNRRSWVLLNRIRTGHGRCGTCMLKWNFSTSATCDCGHPEQTMSHIVNNCPIRALSGGIQELHALSPNAMFWLDNLDLML